MNEYIIKYKIGTDWHEPYNTTEWNYYTEIVEAENGKQAWKKELSHYENLLRHPNKSFELISIKKIG